MAKSTIKLTGDPVSDIDILLKECSNNNQISYHIKNNGYLLDFLKSETGLNETPMILLYHFKERIKDIPKCLCGKKRKYHCYGYRPTCGSKSCQNVVREKKKRDTCLKKYGVEYITQTNIMKEKSKKTLLEKYGVDNSTKSKEIIEKRQKNNLKKWGVKEPISLDKIRSKTISDAERGFIKIQKGLPEKYKLISVNGLYYTIKCKSNHTFEISKYTLSNRKKDNIEPCNLCNEYIGSQGEQEVYEYISSIYDGMMHRSDRKLISPYEIDIVLPDMKICIEFNGDYWHSTKVNDDMNYHLNKTNMCLEKGYKLLQIREFEWNTQKDIIKRKLYNIINDIIDESDYDIRDNVLMFDISWYDDRIIKESRLVGTTEPSVIGSGQYETWNCGYKIFELN